MTNSNSLLNFIAREARGWQRREVAWLIFACAAVTAAAVWRGETSIIAYIAAITGCAAAVFTGQGKMGGFILGTINSVLYGYISFQYQYYGEVMVKFLVFIPMNIIGLFAWSKHIDSDSGEALKRRLSTHQRLWLVAAIACLAAAYGAFLKLLGGNLPYFDGLSTILATAALILCLKRYCEQWLIWVIINCINIYLWVTPFLTGNGKPVAILAMWILYLANSIIMYLRWLKLTNIGQKQ